MNTYTVQMSADQMVVIHNALVEYQKTHPKVFEEDQVGGYLLDLTQPINNEPDVQGQHILNGWTL
jgi:hypothetical protein